MAIDQEVKIEYNKHIAEEKKIISELDKAISELKKKIHKDKKLAPLLRIGVILHLLQRIEVRLKMNEAFEQMMGNKNQSFLDEARRDIYQIFSQGEGIVTLKIDESVDFNREMLDAIKPFNIKQRLNMYKHIKKVIRDLIHAYGENTKWKWSFPELWTKAAIIAKNIFDFREFQANKDPRKEFYYDIQEFLQVIKTDLFFAAKEYAKKFRLSTQSTNDIMMGVRLLEDLRRISSLTGDQELFKKSKAGIESYKSSLRAEEEKKQGKEK